MENYKEELETIQATIQTKKEEKIRLEEKIKQLEEEKKGIIEELKAEGLTPEELEASIATLEKDLIEGIAQCKKTLQLN